MSTISSNNSTSGTPAGLMLPKVNGMVGSTPQNSAYQSLNNMNQKQAALANAVGGKRKLKKRGGAVTVPVLNIPYTVSNAGGQDPNSQIVTNSSNSMQGAAYRVNDQLASVLTGGSIKWGCYSGGKKRRCTRRKKKCSRRKSRRVRRR
jgi:hypothetical protein